MNNNNTNGTVRAVITITLKAMYIFINKRKNNSFTDDSNLTKMYPFYLYTVGILEDRLIDIVDVLVSRGAGQTPTLAEKALYSCLAVFMLHSSCFSIYCTFPSNYRFSFSKILYKIV